MIPQTVVESDTRQNCVLEEREKYSIYIQALYKQKELVKVYKPLSST